MEFKIERIESIQDRLPDALIDAYTVKEGEIPNPTSRENVFDFRDDLRLAIVRDDSNTIHVVAMTKTGSPYAKGNCGEQIVDYVVKRTKEIGLLDIIGKSDTVATIMASGALHLQMNRGSGELTIENEQITMTESSHYGG